MTTTTSVLEASNAVLLQFERPASILKEGEAKQQTIQKRAAISQSYYDKYAKQEVNSVMTNSPLATYTRITKNKSTMSNKVLERVSIHCFVGQVTAQRGVDYFATTDRECSSNYVVGYDGSIGLSVEEKDRSWCTSSRDNDQRAITIEVASETVDPYAVTDAAYNALINLLVDICQRNGKTKMVWIADKTKALAYQPASNELLMTVHRWFAAKACPGEYLYSRHGQIAAAVNDRLNGTPAITPQPEEDEDMTQEKFNEMMNNYLADLQTKPATFEQDALVWAQQNGLMVGNEKGELMPKRFLTRGEFAVVLKRYDESKK